MLKENKNEEIIDFVVTSLSLVAFQLASLSHFYFCGPPPQLARVTYVKSNLLLNSLYYPEECNELAGPISASLRPGNTARFEEMLQRWRAVDMDVIIFVLCNVYCIKIKKLDGCCMQPIHCTAA